MTLYLVKAQWWHPGPTVSADCPEQTSNEASLAAASKPSSPACRAWHSRVKNLTEPVSNSSASCVFMMKWLTASWKLNSTTCRLLGETASFRSLARSSRRLLVNCFLSGERMLSRKQVMSSVIWSAVSDDPSPCFWEGKSYDTVLLLFWLAEDCLCAQEHPSIF